MAATPVEIECLQWNIDTKSHHTCSNSSKDNNSVDKIKTLMSNYLHKINACVITYPCSNVNAGYHLSAKEASVCEDIVLPWNRCLDMHKYNNEF